MAGDRCGIRALLIDVEPDRTERKESLSERGTIRQAIGAIANDLPNQEAAGVLFIGARSDSSCAGLAITDELLLTLANMRSDGGAGRLQGL